MSLHWNMKQLDCLNIYKIQFPNYSIGTIKEFKCENTHQNRIYQLQPGIFPQLVCQT